MLLDKKRVGIIAAVVGGSAILVTCISVLLYYKFRAPEKTRAGTQKFEKPPNPQVQTPTTSQRPSQQSVSEEGKKYRSLLTFAKKPKGIPREAKSYSLIADLDDDLIGRLSKGDAKVAQGLKALKPRYELYKQAAAIIDKGLPCKSAQDSKRRSLPANVTPSTASSPGTDFTPEEYEFIASHREDLESLNVTFPNKSSVRDFLMKHTKKLTTDIVNEFEEAFSAYRSNNFSKEQKDKASSLYDDVCSRLRLTNTTNQYPQYQPKGFGEFAFEALRKDFDEAYLKYRTCVSNSNEENETNKKSATEAFLRFKNITSTAPGQQNPLGSVKKLEDYKPNLKFHSIFLKDRIQKFEESCTSASRDLARQAFKDYKQALTDYIRTHYSSDLELQTIPESERKEVQEFADFDAYYRKPTLQSINVAVDSRDNAKIDLALQCARLITESNAQIKALVDNATSATLLNDVTMITKGPKDEDEYRGILDVLKTIHISLMQGTQVFVKKGITLEAFGEFVDYCNTHKDSTTEISYWDQNEKMIKDIVSSYETFFPDMQPYHVDRYDIVPSKDMLTSPKIIPQVYLKLFPKQDFSKVMKDESKCIGWANIPNQYLTTKIFLESVEVLVLLYSHDVPKEPQRLPEPWIDYLLATPLPLQLSSLPTTTTTTLRPFEKARYLCISLLWMYQVQQTVFWELVYANNKPTPKLENLKARYHEVLKAVEEDFDWKTDMRESDEFIDDKLNYIFEWNYYGEYFEPNFAEIVMEKKYYDLQRRYFNDIDDHKQIILNAFKAPLFETKSAELATNLGLTLTIKPESLNTFINSILDLFYLAGEPIEVITTVDNLESQGEELLHSNWLYRIRCPLIMLTGPQMYVRQLRRYIHHMNDYAAVTDFKKFVRTCDWGTIYFGMKRAEMSRFTNLKADDIELLRSSLLTWGGGSWSKSWQSEANLLIRSNQYKGNNRNEGGGDGLQLRTLNVLMYHLFTNIGRQPDADLKASMQGYVDYLTKAANLDKPKSIPTVTYLKPDGKTDERTGTGEGMKMILMFHLNVIFKFLTYYFEHAIVSDPEKDPYLSQDVFGLGPQHHSDFYKIFATLIGKNTIMGAPMQVFVYPDLWEWLMTKSSSSENDPPEKEFQGYEYDWLLWFPKLSMQYEPINLWGKDLNLVPKFFLPDQTPEVLTDFKFTATIASGPITDPETKSISDLFGYSYDASPKEVRENYNSLKEIVQCHLAYFMKRMIKGRKEFQDRIKEYFGKPESNNPNTADDIVADVDGVAHLGCQLFPLDADKIAEAIEKYFSSNETFSYWVRDLDGSIIGPGPAIARIFREFGEEEGEYENYGPRSQALLKGFLSLFNGRSTLPPGGYDQMRFQFTASYGSTSRCRDFAVKAGTCSGTLFLPTHPFQEQVTKERPIDYEKLKKAFTVGCLNSLKTGEVGED